MKRTIIRLILQGIRDLALNPLAQLSTLFGVTLMAFLSGLFLMALTTLDAQLGTVRGETVFQIYWHPGTQAELIKEQWENYSHLPYFISARTFTPEQALKELGERIGKGQAPLEKNFPFLAKKSPLPATALVSFAPEVDDLEAWVKESTAFLKTQPGVSRVVTTPLKDELGRAWRTMSRYVMWPSIAFLSLVLGLVVGNTVRLSLIARAHEIEILQMIGAFNWYIRLPLVVSGTLLGLGGGLGALLLLKLIHLRIEDILNFPPLLMRISFPSASLTLCLVLVPAFMAALASWLAVRSR